MIPYWNSYWNNSNPTVPKFYWMVKSQEQLIQEICARIKCIIEYNDSQTEQININKEDIAELKKIIYSIENGEYFDKYIDGLAKWIDDNLINLIGRFASYVFPSFYIEPETGVVRFAFIVPESWDFLNFEWFFDESDNTYHISIKY